ncbi:phasin family protein [Rhodospirillum sp. A1_3_36]|uniref:phasin family protein n=1 Tax=Rhodospirillum sp. A1_3_36 TaxID=3391666 RepID=UPI0039A714DA
MSEPNKPEGVAPTASATPKTAAARPSARRAKAAAAKAPAKQSAPAEPGSVKPGPVEPVVEATAPPVSTPAAEPVAAKPTASAEAPASAIEGEMASVDLLKAVEDVVEAGSVSAEAGRSALETVARVGVDVVSETYEKAIVFTKEQVEVVEKAGGPFGLGVGTGIEDGLSFLKANLEAMGESSAILVKGGQDLTILSYDYMKDMVEDGATFGRDLMDCGGPEKALEMEMAAVEKATEKAMAVGQRVGDLVSKMLEDATVPLTERAESAVASLNKAFAVK